MKQYLVKEHSHPTWAGVQKIYRFPNGFGASVIRAGEGGSWTGSYGAEDGLWELAVLKWDGEKSRLTYETSITDDVMGRLTQENVDDILKDIHKLKEEV